MKRPSEDPESAPRSKRGRDGAADLVPDQGGLYYGLSAPISQCRTITGYDKRPTLDYVMRQMLKTQVFQYQTLVQNDATGNWRSNGSFRFNTYAQGTTLAYPLTINYPVYIFRIGVPNGRQTVPSVATAVDGTVKNMRPTMCYRLRSIQNSATSPVQFEWNSVDPSQNCSEPPYPAGTSYNMQSMVRGDDANPFETPAPIHNWSTINLLYTDATTIQTTLVCGLVKFTDSEFCPPDFGYDGDVANNVQITYRGNSTNYTPTSMNSFSEFWNHYINQREGHPLRYEEVGRPPRRVFNWLSKKVRTFTPAVNYSLSTVATPTGLQHLHSETVRGMGPTNCSIGKAADLIVVPNRQAEVGPQIEQNEVGIFPARAEEGRWFMVQGWPRRGINPNSTNPNFNTNEPTFDIRIRQSFSSTENYH